MDRPEFMCVVIVLLGVLNGRHDGCTTISIESQQIALYGIQRDLNASRSVVDKSAVRIEMR